MKKPQDSDIFGTKFIGYAPRITNQLDYDPNSQFQAKMDAQYEAYSRKITPVSSMHSTNTNFNVGSNGSSLNTHAYAKVNEEAEFDENYHKVRKDADMQSNIFYQPTSQLPNSRLTERSRITERHVPKHAYHVHNIHNNNSNNDQIQPSSHQYHNQQENEFNFGKKQTLGREIKAMPENGTRFTGNSSNIFGYDQHVNRNGVKNKVEKLIPHQMQWTDHDSVRYQDASNAKVMGIEDVIQSKSQVLEVNKVPISKKVEQVSKNNELTKQNNSKSSNMLKKPTNQTPAQTSTKPLIKINNNPASKVAAKQQQGPKIVVSQNPQSSNANKTDNNKVEINILKGWSSSIMEQLSKWCRLNSTKIMSVNFEQAGKGTLVLERSKRWEAVTDWLRKDAKLKIRVMN